ncbi:MAG: SH3 domain-containing protein [Clostridia bacterium]|nr:SH3 domain-containing protein [Clostridia bacterium]
MKTIFTLTLLVMLLTFCSASAEVLFFSDIGRLPEESILEITQTDGSQFLVPLAGVPRVYAPDGLIGLDVIPADRELFEKAELLSVDGSSGSTASSGQLTASPLYAIHIQSIGTVPDIVQRLIIIQDGDFPAYSPVYAADGITKDGRLFCDIAAGDQFILVLQTGGDITQTYYLPIPINVSDISGDAPLLIQAYNIDGREAPFKIEATRRETLRPTDQTQTPEADPVTGDTATENGAPDPSASDLHAGGITQVESSPSQTHTGAATLEYIAAEADEETEIITFAENPRTEQAETAEVEEPEDTDADETASDPVAIRTGTLFIPDPGLPVEKLQLFIEEDDGLTIPLFTSSYSIKSAPDGLVGIEVTGMDIDHHGVVEVSSASESMAYESYSILNPLPGEGTIHAVRIQTNGLPEGAVSAICVDNARMTFSADRPLADTDAYVFPSPDCMLFSLVAYAGENTDDPETQLCGTSVDIETLNIGESRGLFVQPADDIAEGFTITFTKTAVLRDENKAADSDAPHAADGADPTARSDGTVETAAEDTKAAAGLAVTDTIQTDVTGYVTIRYSGYIRDGDNTGCMIVRSVRTGQIFRTFGRTENGWYIVELPENSAGYISPNNCRFSKHR